MDQKSLPIFTIHNEMLLSRLIQSLRTSPNNKIHESISTIGTFLYCGYFALKTLLVCRKVLLAIDLLYIYLYIRRLWNNC